MITALSIGKGGLGRFGNQLFTIAGCIGIAVKSGQPYGFPKWINHDAKDIFNTNEDVNIYQHLVNQLPEIPDISFQEYGYFWGYRDIFLPTGNWSIDAHMQSEKFFKHCLSLIRDTFRFKDEPPQSDLVAVHYRAGDYIEDLNAYHPRQPKEYYEKAMSCFPGEKFLVFSDNTEEAKSKIFRENVSYQSGDYLTDFKLMKKCKSFITSNSSFPLMAAILGEHPDKKIVCPKLWFGAQAGGLPSDDCYPENAIVI